MFRNLKRREEGFSIVELVLIVAILGILAIISIPSYSGMRQRAYNASSRSAGRQFVSAQGVYETEFWEYATDLDQLLEIDKNLTDSVSVTFLWLDASASGYTVNVTHQSGNRWYTYSENK